MKQAIVIFLKEEKKIQNARKRYQKDYKKYKPHISLVYTFNTNNQDLLNRHIKNNLKNIKPFTLTLSRLKKSTKGFYLYLITNKGTKQINYLYKKLNSGILNNFKNKDMPKYIPHITLGVFKSKEEINNAIKELKREDIKFKTKVKSIQLLALNKDDSLKSVKNYSL